jgi:uncharacterized membrane protein HdeD (DUF308 family)
MADAQKTPSATDIAKHVQETIAQHWGWFIALGVALVLLGMTAVIFPLVSTLAAEQFFGWLLLFGGLIQCVHSYRTKTWAGFALELAIGLLYLAGGFILISNPMSGIVTLTLLLIVLFVIDGILRSMLAFKLRPARGWGWVLMSGIVSLIVGGLIWAEFPSSALWAIGLLVGLNLMFSGLSFLSLAMAGRAIEAKA